MDGIVSTKALTSKSDIDAVKSLIPDFKDSRMNDYLTLRSFMFTHEEVCAALNINDTLWGLWTLIPEFNDWILKDLRKLQRSIGSELVRVHFMRNMFLQMHIDNQVLHMRAFEKHLMDKEDRDDAREAAKRYTVQNLKAMMDVVDEEQGTSKSGMIEFSIKVDIGATEEEEAKRRQIQARKLLKDFRLKETPQNMKTIDGASGQLIDDNDWQPG